MAEKNKSLLSKVSLNPLDPAALKELDNNFGVSTMEKQVADRSAKLRRDILGSAGFKDQFTRILNRQAPVEKEIADAGQALSGIENPYVRRQAMDNATSAKNLRRQDIAGQFNDTLTTRLQAEQLLLTQQNNELANARAERNAALNIVGQQYLDTLRNNQEMANYQKKLDIDRSLGIGDFAPRGGGGGGGGGNSQLLTYFKQTADEGLKQLQAGMEWGPVWNSIRQQLPPEISNEAIDAALYKENWIKPGAYQQYSKNKSQNPLMAVLSPGGMPSGIQTEE